MLLELQITLYPIISYCICYKLTMSFADCLGLNPNLAHKFTLDASLSLVLWHELFWFWVRNKQAYSTCLRSRAISLVMTGAGCGGGLDAAVIPRWCPVKKEE